MLRAHDLAQTDQVIQDGFATRLRRSQLIDTRIGHVGVQRLPIWLPKVRIDSSNTHSTVGWFSENYLPYRKPEGW